MSLLEAQLGVLDHGYVRLVDSMGDDLSIVKAARVSNNLDTLPSTEERDRKLMRYLLTNHHTSPFEHVMFTFEVKAPIFIFRQWHRHRTWSFSEISGRYAPVKDEFYIPAAHDIGTQSKSNKQARVRSTAHNNDLYEGTAQIMRASMLESFKIYEVLLARAVPRELARIVLPLSTYSRMYATVDLHNLMNFLRLRLHEHAQWEIQQYARAMAQIAMIIAPEAMAGFGELYPGLLP